MMFLVAIGAYLAGALIVGVLAARRFHMILSTPKHNATFHEHRRRAALSVGRPFHDDPRSRKGAERSAMVFFALWKGGLWPWEVAVWTAVSVRQWVDHRVLSVLEWQLLRTYPRLKAAPRCPSCAFPIPTRFKIDFADRVKFQFEVPVEMWNAVEGQTRALLDRLGQGFAKDLQTAVENLETIRFDCPCCATPLRVAATKQEGAVQLLDEVPARQPPEPRQRRAPQGLLHRRDGRS